MPLQKAGNLLFDYCNPSRGATGQARTFSADTIAPLTVYWRPLMIEASLSPSGRPAVGTGMGVPAAVGHLDADCFYISAERVRNAFLLGKPVGVLGNQGAFVIAKSYEMKAAGVKTGDPIWEAIVKCPDGVYVKRDFRWYEVLSRLMLDVVREFSPEVEYYSIDEFFFRVPLNK